MRWYATCGRGGVEVKTYTGGRRTSTYDKDKLEVVYERPFDCVAIPFVFFFRGSALDECFADERVDRRCGGGSDMRGFGRERARPEYNTACNQSSNGVLNKVQLHTFVRNRAVIQHVQ